MCTLHPSPAGLVSLGQPNIKTVGVMEILWLGHRLQASEVNQALAFPTWGAHTAQGTRVILILLAQSPQIMSPETGDTRILRKSCLF